VSVHYPWYEIVEGEGLEQGDLLRQCPVILPASDLSFPLPDETMPADVLTFDVVVMTQSCDLANDKISDVILCPHWDLGEAGLIDAAIARKDVQKSILSGYRHRYAMLAATEVAELPMNIRVIDFGRIFCLPKAFVCQFAAGQGRRLRLCPPYREHLSQSFARFFMRVGLPQNIELPK
jgi:hypothetical protein